MRAQRSALKRIAIEDARDRVQTMDLPAVGVYLFDTLGAMSIREYARDIEARQFVARAIDRVEDFLEEGKEETETGFDHLAIARTALEKGDVVGGLARLRLAVELKLAELAMDAELPPSSGTRLIKMLQRAGILDPESAESLVYVYRVGSQGVHGKDVDLSQAREVLEIARRVLTVLDRRKVEPG